MSGFNGRYFKNVVDLQDVSNQYGSLFKQNRGDSQVIVAIQAEMSTAIARINGKSPATPSYKKPVVVNYDAPIPKRSGRKPEIVDQLAQTQRAASPKHPAVDPGPEFEVLEPKVKRGTYWADRRNEARGQERAERSHNIVQGSQDQAAYRVDKADQEWNHGEQAAYSAYVHEGDSTGTLMNMAAPALLLGFLGLSLGPVGGLIGLIVGSIWGILGNRPNPSVGGELRDDYPCCTGACTPSRDDTLTGGL